MCPMSSALKVELQKFFDVVSRDLENPYTITLDDDPVVRLMIEKIIGIKSLPFTSAQKLVAEAGRYKPIAAFIDIHLDASQRSLDKLPLLRQKWPMTPIIVITGDDSDAAVGEALACGADDFIRKPIHPQELIARLQVRLSEKHAFEKSQSVKLSDINIHRAYKSVEGPLGKSYLSQTALNLLLILIEANGTVVPRETLKQRTWGDVTVSDNALDRKVCEVRKALTDTTSKIVIQTKYGKGFSLGIE